MSEITGIIPPVVTPLKENEDLDLPRLKWFIDHLLDKGVHGIFVLGTNSEFYAFSEDEKQQIFSTAVEHVNGRAPVHAGTGAETTREVIRLTQMAEKEGVNGVSVISPYFIKPSQQELYDHFRRVAESTSLPVILYNNPATCGGVNIHVDTVSRLAEIPNIVAIKDSSGDLQNVIELIRNVPSSFSVMMGRDTLIYHAMISGAKGAVPATGNIAPELVVRIYESIQRGDYEDAFEAQRLLHSVRMSLTLCTAPGGVKAALDMLNMSMGPCRAPVAGLTEEAKPKMRAMLSAAGLL